MKKRNFLVKLISFILCITMLSPTMVQATNINNTETISGHWAEETLTYWDMLGLFNKIPVDEFGVDKPITRGAFVYIFNTMLSIKHPEKTANIFTDITESNWNYADIVTAYNIGYISGYPDNTFRADSPITREEMCTVISRYFGLNKVYNDSKLQNFTDKDKIQSYALDHIGALAELETVNGYPNGSFKPQNNITYAEAVTIITRFLSYINGGSGISGRVYYEDKPVYNAKISIYENDSTSIVTESGSDLYGDYIIDVPAGTYDVMFAKDGTVFMLADVEVSDDIRTYNKIRLETGEYVTGTIVDENNNEDISPDYSYLPYREPKTMEELVELNGGEQPYIVIKKDNTIGLYIGEISNKEIKDVYDVIAELNVLSNLYGFEDTRIEYIPYGEDGKDGEDSYRLQQVYNGVVILSTGISVSVDEDNRIHSILGKYNADVKYANIDTENIITKEESERIIKQYFADTLNIENFTVKSNRLIIHDSACKLMYYSQISANHSVYNIMIDAITGNIESCSELENSFS